MTQEEQRKKYLKPFTSEYHGDPETHKANSSKGGKNKERYKQRKMIKEVLIEVLDKTYTNKNGEQYTGLEAITAALLKKAMAGDVRAFATIRDTIGEKPAEKVLIAEVDESVIDQVESMINGTDDAGENNDEE